MVPLEASQVAAARYMERVALLQASYRAGSIHAHIPPELLDAEGPPGDVAATSFPASHAALEGASNGLFYSLPVAFDPAESVGPYLATVDRDAAGEPYRFMDLGALIASQPFGENDPEIAAAVLRDLPFLVSRYAHSEYQTVLSLKLKAALDEVAPSGTPRHFVVNTGAEAVENAIKSVLLNRVKSRSPEQDVGQSATPERLGLFLISFEGGFHGRTLGSLAATHRKRARLGFPTFDWPHVGFPIEDCRFPQRTRRRAEKSLEQVWDLMVTGRIPGTSRPRAQFWQQLRACDDLLASLPAERSAWPHLVAKFVAWQRTLIEPVALQRAQRVAGVLVEPIQGEGGLRFAPAWFFQCLRLLTRIYDVPLLLDEVQTGWGATGRLWAHELFDLPCPPDAVVWAKKAQNGVLFVSEELAAFFQEEKKFNTTWEGDSGGMVRLLACLRRLDLEQVRTTGTLARSGLERLTRDYRGLLRNVRGIGCMLAVDVVRPDWRDVLRDRAFRRGLILLPAGERTLRFYPRYDMEPYAIEEALTLFRNALEDVIRGRLSPAVRHGPEIRVGTLEARPGTLDALVIKREDGPLLLPQIIAVEAERYGGLAHYPPGVLKAGRRPLLQYPEEALQATLAFARCCGVALQDRVSQRVLAYALGSALEDHDELGVREDPRYGDGDVVYLQAMAVSPFVRNQAEVEGRVLDAFLARARELGFSAISSLIEARFRETGPAWIRNATVLETVDNYLQSGMRFVYLQALL
ncbi:MAG TPA: aminotransferase class III-fold pyridoxal phosphate-dependent enzyme [Anaeromyxobacteraceae bacterium]|nr:aminotransferase class III-fold pyridoxal phosphate-dependent enzyme [Anaeromyxobacteraceae bacterium]